MVFKHLGKSWDECKGEDGVICGLLLKHYEGVLRELQALWKVKFSKLWKKSEERKEFRRFNVERGVKDRLSFPKYVDFLVSKSLGEEKRE